MKTTKRSIKSLKKNRRGVSMLEYAAMGVAVTIAAAVTWKATGYKVGVSAANSGEQVNAGGQ